MKRQTETLEHRTYFINENFTELVRISNGYSRKHSEKCYEYFLANLHILIAGEAAKHFLKPIEASSLLGLELAWLDKLRAQTETFN